MFAVLLFALGDAGCRCLFAYRSPTGLIRVNDQGPKRYSLEERKKRVLAVVALCKVQICFLGDKVKSPDLLSAERAAEPLAVLGNAFLSP
jgi:hypothetical protein